VSILPNRSKDIFAFSSAGKMDAITHATLSFIVGGALEKKDLPAISSKEISVFILNVAR
jgi:hypothetical protein